MTDEIDEKQKMRDRMAHARAARGANAAPADEAAAPAPEPTADAFKAAILAALAVAPTAEMREALFAQLQAHTQEVPLTGAAGELERAAPNQPPGRVRITLDENEGIPPCGQFFGINGASYLLRPGLAADVPMGIIDVLDNAIMSVPVRDPRTAQITGWRTKRRYPYTVERHA